MPILYHHIDSSNSDDYSVTDEPELPEDVDLTNGVRIEVSLPDPLVFDVDYPSRDELPHFVGTLVPVFSQRLVETFLSAGVGNFQIFRAVLRNAKIGETWDGYWAVNVIGRIAAANREKSDADTIMEGDPEGVSVPLLAFHELVLDAKKTRNVALFRLAESPDMLLLHERVMAHLRRHRPQNGWGFDVTEIETL